MDDGTRGGSVPRMRLAPIVPATAVALAALTSLASPLAAQVPPLLPYPRTLDLLVVDSTLDGVWRLADLDQNGDTNGPGEGIVFYSDTVGSIALTTPTCVVAGPDGTVYVGDASADIVLALRDLDGDGDANDPGEHRVFFDSATNLGGVTMASVQGLTVDAAGRLFLAVANSGTTGSDVIVLLHDLDGDGDANDANEARVYCTIPGGGGAAGNSIPTKVVVAPDTSLYYADVASSGSLQRGVYRLFDANSDGDCDDPGEFAHFWTPTAGSAQYWSLAVDATGAVYVGDHSANEQVWRAFDANGNHVIEPGEQTLFYQSPGSTWWDLVVREDGTVLLCEDQAPDRITTLRDSNNDGDANDPGEAGALYDSTLSPVAVAPRGAALLRAPLLALVPPSVQVGSGTTLSVQATKPGDLTLVVISVGLGQPFALPPWGVVEVDPTAFTSVALGFADASGFFTVPFQVPNVPTAVGTWAFQALSGDQFRLFLSNAAVLTVTP